MKSLVIKLGALGDVVRTTTLLNVLEGEVCWVTRENALPLLPARPLLTKYTLKDHDLLSKYHFDLVISLDDEKEAAQLASSVRASDLIGSYLDESGKVVYTDSSAEWFDMGLISRHGKQKADSLKLKNVKSYQEILFSMLNLPFQAEKCIINLDEITPRKIAGEKVCIGIEERAGDRWPTKRWNKYHELAEILRTENCEVVFFQNRDNIMDYVKDISAVDLVICGDTLAMHVALALRRSTITLFMCTTPVEIYGYDCLTKIVSPLLAKCFYSQEYMPEVVNAITLDEVLNAARQQIKSLKMSQTFH